MIRFKMEGVKFRFVFGRSTQSYSAKRFVETIMNYFFYPEINYKFQGTQLYWFIERY